MLNNSSWMFYLYGQTSGYMRKWTYNVLLNTHWKTLTVMNAEQFLMIFGMTKKVAIWETGHRVIYWLTDINSNKSWIISHGYWYEQTSGYMRSWELGHILTHRH